MIPYFWSYSDIETVYSQILKLTSRQTPTLLPVFQCRPDLWLQPPVREWRWWVVSCFSSPFPFSFVSGIREERGERDGDHCYMTHAHEFIGLVQVLRGSWKRDSASGSFCGFWWLLVKLSQIFPLMPMVAPNHSSLLHSVLWPSLWWFSSNLSHLFNSGN